MNPASRHLRESPPRYVSLLTRMLILWGSPLQMGAWFFLFLGSIFAWIFVGQSELPYLFQSEKKWMEAPGEIFSQDATSMSQNEVTIYKALATFEVDGETFLAKGYVSGPKFSPQEKVDVQYSASDPNHAFIKGTRKAAFSSWVAFVFLFPMIGLIGLLAIFAQNRKRLNLLVNGIFTRGELKNKEITNTRINNMPVFKYQFAFKVGGKEYHSKCKTHQASRVEDEEREIILYDPMNPEKSAVYDAGPMPEIDVHGQLVQAPFYKWLFFLVPLLTIGLNIYFLKSGVPFFE